MTTVQKETKTLFREAVARASLAPSIHNILESLAPAAGRRRHAAPKRNAMHYDSEVFERVDWSLRGAHMEQRHSITAEVANDALGDANRVVIDPDYNSTTGRSARIIGFSVIADNIVTVIVLADEGFEYGVNGWLANEKDRRLYNQGGQHEQED
jgi:hypothetical protein